MSVLRLFPRTFIGGAPGARAIIRALAAAGALIMTTMQAQAALDPPLCDRSVELQAVILELTPANDHCGDFPESALREATELNARSKGIASLKRGDFHDFDSLNDLNLAYNRLRHLPGNVFDGLGEMNGELYLEGNQLSVVSRDAFNGLGNLTRLNLWANGLKTLPRGMFRDLDELTYLNLGNNQLSSFHIDAFDNLGELRELHLHNNQLETLPDRDWLEPLGVGRHTQYGILQVLNLSGNQLRELQEEPFRPIRHSLRQLRLDNNRLTWLPEGIFKEMDLGPTRGAIQISGIIFVSVEDVLPGALRLDGDKQGDGRPFGDNPDGQTTTAHEVFTLPYYLFGELRDLRAILGTGDDDFQFDEPEVRTPHYAPFGLGITWVEDEDGLVGNIETSRSIFQNRLNGIRAGRDNSESSTAEMHWRKSDGTDEVDWNITVPDFSASNCGFSPCYDGFGFHSYGWSHPPGADRDRERCPSPRVNYVNNEEKCNPDGDIVPTFTSSPADAAKGYVAGEEVEVRVLFDRGPLVKFDPIVVRLRIGGEVREAKWVPTNAVGVPPVTIQRGDQTYNLETLRFRYRITDEDADTDGIEILSMSGDGDIRNEYGRSGSFGGNKNFNLPSDAAHKVYSGPYVSLVSGDRIFAKEGESFDVNFRVTPAPADSMDVEYRMNRNFTGGTHWTDYHNSPGPNRDGGTVTVGRDGRGSVNILIRSSGGDNENPERAQEPFRVVLEDTDDYELGDIHQVWIEIKEGVCDRTPEVQAALMAVTGRRDCGDVTIEDLAVIGELDMRGHGINSLRPLDFLGLDHVSVLDLRNNHLSAFPEGVFGEISDTLKVLRLQGNRWQRDLPGGMFTGLPNVQAIFVNDDLNPGADDVLRLPLRIDFADEAPDFPLTAGSEIELKAVLSQGAPYAFTVRLTGEDLDVTLEIVKGGTESDTVTWPVSEEANRIEIFVSELSAPPKDCPTKDGEGRCFSGLEIVSRQKVAFDGASPMISSVRVTSTPVAGDAYTWETSEDLIVVSLDFSEEVVVVLDEDDGTPTLALRIGETTRLAVYDPVLSVTNRLSFRYRPQGIDNDTDGISVPAGALSLNGARIVDLTDVAVPAESLENLPGLSDNPGHKVAQDSPPVILSARLASTPAEGGIYISTNPEDLIIVSLDFNKDIVILLAGDGRLPTLALRIGETTRTMVYDPELSAPRRLVFRYKPLVTDEDADGVSIPDDALSLNGARVTNVSGIPAEAESLENLPGLSDDPGHKVARDSPPMILSVRITSTPVEGDAYTSASPEDAIVVALDFNKEVVVVPGEGGNLPTLALKVGETTRSAIYDSTSSTINRLIFRYKPLATDGDADGVSIPPGALMLHGARIVSLLEIPVADDFPENLPGLSDDPRHKVGRSTAISGGDPPMVSSVRITSAPVEGDAYVSTNPEDLIVVSLDFSEEVVVVPAEDGGLPTLALSVGETTRTMVYDPGLSATNRLSFGYRPLSTDEDTDGVSVPDAALTLRDARIVDLAGLSVTAESLENLPGLSDDPRHKVERGRPPMISRVRITSTPVVGDTYTAENPEDRIVVALDFDEEVVVVPGGDGRLPTLALRIGETTRLAIYDSALSTTDRLAFGYRPLATDEDTDGVSIPTGALMFYGSRVVNLLEVPVPDDSLENLSGLSDDPGHKVGRSTAISGGDPPVVSSVRITSTPVAGDAYTSASPEDLIVVSLDFSEEVVVVPAEDGGLPTLALSVGETTRTMIYAPGLSTTNRLAFGYRPLSVDEDTDGVSVPAAALTLHDARIVNLADVAVTAESLENLPGLSDDPKHKVERGRSPMILSVRITSTPVEGDAYTAENPEDRIVVSLSFDEEVVVVSGGGGRLPTLALRVGETTRSAIYDSALSTTNRLAFNYRLQGFDEDADGVSVPPGALSLNGARIVNLADAPVAAESLENLPGLPDDPGHKVRRGIVILDSSPPIVSSVRITSTPVEGDAYTSENSEDRIVVSIYFVEEVVVLPAGNGNLPTLTLRIGETTRTMIYDPELSATNRLAFGYTPQDSDEDADGVSVPTGALSLNGARIVSRAEVAITAESLENLPGLPDDPGHKVGRGVTVTPPPAPISNPPMISSVRITSAPVEGDAYTSRNPEDRIVVSLDFSEEVVVVLSRDGRPPTLALRIGETTRTMVYERELSSTNRLAFGYRPLSVDEDTDGVSVPAGALALNGARIVNLEDIPVTAESLRNLPGLPDDPKHKVERDEPPMILGVRIASTPVEGDTYTSENPEDLIVVSLDFDEEVVVMPAGDGSLPTLALRVGETTRSAIYNSALSTTDRLAFSYRPLSSDEDTNGISIPVGALSLNGARIVDLADVPVAAESLENLPGLPDASGHKVGRGIVILAGSPPMVSSVRITSTPVEGDAYTSRNPEDRIVVSLDFNERVSVVPAANGGLPTLALRIGMTTRTMVYAPALGTTNRLAFNYRPRDSDEDADGVSVPAGALSLNGASIVNLEEIPVPAESLENLPGLPDDPRHKVERVVVDTGAGVMMRIRMFLEGALE